MAFSSTLMASFSCSPARPCSPVQVSLASSSSVFISCGGRALVSLWSLRQVVRRRTGGDGRSRGLDCRCIFGLGVPELVVIAGVAALVFGPKKLPEIGRSIGKTVKSFQQAAKEFESELKKEPETITQPATSEKTNGSVEASRAVKSEEDKELEVTGTKESP